MRPVRSAELATDNQGRFVFRNLAKGTYSITTTTTGASFGFSVNGCLVSGAPPAIGPYVNGGYGQRRPNGPLDTVDVADDQKIGDIKIQIWKCAAIEGRAMDEANDPLVGVVVAAVERSSDGRLLNGPTTITDDRGAYHFGSLAPGMYIVVVPHVELAVPISAVDPEAAIGPSTMPPTPALPTPSIGVQIGETMLPTRTSASVTATNTLPPLERAGRMFAYQTTFYPASTSVGSADAIELHSGDLRAGIDVHLQLLPAVAVSGVLSGPEGPAVGMNVDLFPADAGNGAAVLEVASARTDALGAFTFPLVASGRYTISVLQVPPPPSPGAFERATAAPSAPVSSLWVSLPIVVADHDVTNLALVLHTGVRVAGRVEFHGSAAPPAPDQITRAALTLPWVQRPSRNEPVVLRASIDASSQFAFPSVAAGRYLLRAGDIAPMWSVQSITIDGRDVTDAAIVVDDKDVGDVVVSYTDAPGQLAGTVRDDRGVPDPSASVFLFPTDRTRWPDARSTLRAVRTVRVSKNGTFTLARPIAGDYFVIALTDEIAADWPSASFLARLAPLATTVHIESGARLTLSLTTARLR